MGTIDYEALIEERGIGRDELAQRKQASRLAEIARNLETLQEVAAEQAKERAEAPPPNTPDRADEEFDNVTDPSRERKSE
jgi:hypothetical protein